MRSILETCETCSYEAIKTNFQQCLPVFLMFLPIVFLNRHLRLFRASICPARVPERGRSCPRGHISLQIHRCAFPKPWWNVQHTPSGSSASAFLACPSLNRLSYPPVDTVPLLLPAIATSPVGFMLLARLQVPALPLLLTLRTLIRVSLVGSGM